MVVLVLIIFYFIFCDEIDLIKLIVMCSELKE